MLSPTALPVIKAALPAVGANIQDIAQRFYARLFDAHPELLDGVFNRGNQAGVEVLGDAATPEVAAAWEEVYWLMANTLINLERGLYDAVGLAPDTIWRNWRVVERVRETVDVMTLTVERTDGRDVKPSLPGQYVTVQMPTRDNTHQPRQYSLTAADDGHHRRFAVKHVADPGKPDGEVSTLLHDSIRVGDELVLSAPSGDVVMESTDRPVVFASAGIGVTPMAGMLSHLTRQHSARQVVFLHAGASPATFVLRGQVKADLGGLPNAAMITWYEQGPADAGPYGEVRTGFMDVRSADLPADAAYYLCGPLPFMQAVRTDLLSPGVAGCAARAVNAWHPGHARQDLTGRARCPRAVSEGPPHRVPGGRQDRKRARPSP